MAGELPRMDGVEHSEVALRTGSVIAARGSGLSCCSLTLQWNNDARSPLEQTEEWQSTNPQ